MRLDSPPTPTPASAAPILGLPAASEVRANSKGASLRELAKHSLVYGVGQVLARVSSILLLPFYTRFFSPADYGVIAILDLTASVLGIVLGSGMVTAVACYHYEADTDEQQNAVWWTGITFVAVSAVAVLLPCFLLRDWLAAMVLGDQVPRGGALYALMLPTVWFSAINGLADQYFHVRRWSRETVSLALGTLLLNICLNIYFVAGLNLGIMGVLWGNLASSAVRAGLRCAVVRRHWGRFQINGVVLRKLWRFGLPLMGTALLTLVMHQSDRYLLRLYLDYEDVGLYSLAYTIGQAVNNLVLAPFMAIWTVAIYEIAKRDDAAETFARAFRYFILGLGCAMLGLSLFARPILMVAVERRFWSSADLVPIVCLAYIFFSCHIHFRVPALVKKQTASMLPAYITGALVNVAANVALIPRFGTVGAAWATVITFAMFSLVGYAIYSRIDRYPYSFAYCISALAGMSVTYWVVDNAAPFATAPWLYMLLSLTATVCWFTVLFQPWRWDLANEPLTRPWVESIRRLTPKGWRFNNT